MASRRPANDMAPQIKRMAMGVYGVIALSVIAVSQPASPRERAVWKARYENTVWRLTDDGGETPVIGGHLLRGERIYTLVPAAFDYRSNVLRTVAVGGGETQRVEIHYIRDEGGEIVAKIGSVSVRFQLEKPEKP